MLRRVIFFAIDLILLLVPLSAVQGWSPPFRVSPYSSYDISAAVCVDVGGRVWVTWFDPYHLYFRVYDEGAWSEPMLVDSNRTAFGAAVRSSAMCRDTLGQIWVAWVDSAGYIRLSHSDYPRWMWSTTIRDSRIRGGSPGIACDTFNNIWCCWTGFTTVLDTNYYMMTGCYDGDNWTRFDTLAILPPLISFQTAGITNNISGNVWVCWNGEPEGSGAFNVYAQYFDGIDWSLPESIGVCDDMAFPTISADSSGNIWVAWWGKMYVRWAGSDTWSRIQFPNSDTAYTAWPHPDICSDSQGRTWIGWPEARRYHFDTVRVCGGYYQDGDWKDLAIIDSVASPYADWVYPVIAHDTHNVWLVWNSVKGGDSDIYLSYTCATGVTERGEAKDDQVRLTVCPSLFMYETLIQYGLPECSNVHIVIYNLLGEEVTTLINEEQRAATRTLIWDATDDAGRKVPSGTYFLRLEAHTGLGTHAGFAAGNYTATRKVCVVR